MPNRLNDIERAKQKAIDFLKAHTNEMGIAAFAIMIAAIEDTFDIKGGKIQGDKDFIKQLNQLTIDFLDLLQSTPKFTGPVSQFVKRMPEISEAIDKFQKATNGVTVPAFETSKNIVIDEIVDKMLDNGLNQNFVQPLRNLIYQNVTGELSLKDAREAIKEYVQGSKDVSGKLGKYIEQTAQQAVDSYSGIINMKILENFNMDGLLVTGSLIDTSSPQCRFLINDLGGKLTRENWPQFEKIGKDHGLTDGTTFDNIPLRLSHWGCRHSFFPYLNKKIAA